MAISRKPTEAQLRPKIAKILRAALKRKQAARPGYSQRALARDLGTSSVFVTNVLSGKKALPPGRLLDVAHHLELDVHERQLLLGYVARELLPPELAARSAAAPESPLLGQRDLYESGGQHLLSYWYNFAVLEGLALGPPLNALESLRKRLGLNEVQLEAAMRCLIEAGAVVTDEAGRTRKAKKHLYVPTGRSKREIRAFHDAMILKAREELRSRTADADFHRRLITGFTFTANRADVEELKAMVLEFLDGLSRRATRSVGTDVYQCNVQLFPLTRPAAG